MDYKLLVENWRSYLSEIGMSRAALGVSAEEYNEVFEPVKA